MRGRKRRGDGEGRGSSYCKSLEARVSVYCIYESSCNWLLHRNQHNLNPTYLKSEEWWVSNLSSWFSREHAG